MAQLTEHDLQMLKDYKERKAKLLEQEEADKQAKAERELFWKNKSKPHMRTAEVEHPCAGCGETIPEKARALPISHFHTDTFPPYFTTDYYCIKCAVNMEAK